LYKIDKKSFVISGFFIGIFWFWWIGLSFRYYDLTYLIFIVIVVIGLVYMGLFYLVDIFNNRLIRMVLFFSLTWIHPFGFDWFKPQLPLYQLKIKNQKPKINNLKIYIPKYNIAQDFKWDRKNLQSIIKQNFANINYAINNHYDLVVLPETAFPLVLNYNDALLNKLKKLSKKIAIITGGLNYQKDGAYNSAFIFIDTKLTIANKIVLVPFGEKIYLPQFLVDLINKIFFNGANDYKQASKPTYFVIKGIKFTTAICYEATSDKFYQQINSKNIIALSNMAWFYPSIASTLQQILLEYMSFKYQVKIIHSINLF
jgi:apolipoprotein N-acyltransferase